MLHHVEKHIEKMRSKPLHIKKQYSFVVSLAITLVIFGFWISSFATSNSSVVATGATPPSPVSSMTAAAGDAFTYVKDLIFGGNKTSYSSNNPDSIVVTPGKI